MKETITIMKFGGSILTDKSKQNTLNPSFNINPVANKLLNYTENNNPLILIHGAGSFGHPQASKYKLLSVTKYWDSIHSLNYLDLLSDRESIREHSKNSLANHYTDKELESFKIGGQLTKEAVTKLHNHFKNQLTEIGLSIVSIFPSDYLQSYSEIINDNSITIQLKGIKNLLTYISTVIKEGKIPLIHGDVIPDNLNNSKIISGDLIAYLLCCYLNNQDNLVESIYLTDVDGVFDKDPKQFKDAKLIKLFEINNNNNLDIVELKDKSELEGSIKDITGSMLGKLKWAIQSIKNCGKNCIVRVINYNNFILDNNTVETLLKS